MAWPRSSVVGAERVPNPAQSLDDPPRPSRRSRLARWLLVIGLAMVALALGTDVLGSARPLIGGLGLNAAIVGAIFSLEWLVPRLRKHLPPWLGW